MELDDFRKSLLLQSSRGSYTSPALALPATPLWTCRRGTIASNHSPTTSEYPPPTVLKSIGLFCTIKRRFNQRCQYHIWKSASSSGARAALPLPELPTKPEKNCSPSMTRNPKTTEENSRKSFTRKSCFRQMSRRNTPTGQRSGTLSRKWKNNGTRSLPDDSFLPCREKSRPICIRR